jgi:hypothetical protein
MITLFPSAPSVKLMVAAVAWTANSMLAVAVAGISALAFIMFVGVGVLSVLFGSL